MAGEHSALGQTLDRMLHEVSLKLTPEGGRIFVDNADLDRVDQCSIELKCWFSPELFSLDVTIGSEEHPRVKLFEDDEEDTSKEVETEVGWRLSDVPVMLTLHRVDEAWLKGRAEKNDGSPVLGHFHYYPRVNTADGVIRDKRPTVTAWMALGADNFALVRSRLLDFKRFDFEIGLTIAFPQGTVDRHELMGRSVRWDGEGTLPVKSGSIVWRKEDWSPDWHRKERLIEKPQPKAELPYDPPREHLEAMEVSRRIEAALSKLSTPLWIAVAALVAMAVRQAGWFG